MLRVTLDIPEEGHVYTANMPNTETLEAIESVERGHNLIQADDAEDLFCKLMLC
jgi:hypothetical protein